MPKTQRKSVHLGPSSKEAFHIGITPGPRRCVGDLEPGERAVIAPVLALSAGAQPVAEITHLQGSVVRCRITGDAVDDPVHHAQRANVPKTKYTPLEQQVLALKAAHPGVMLVIEVGYKMRLFGRDAEIAADICKLWCGQDHNFMTTSFPVHRMPVYVRRLVEHGHKVGVVRQVETAAIKSVSDSKNKPFERKLVGVYTRATIDAGGMEDLCPTQCDTDGDHEVDGIDTDVATGREGGNYMVCITEEARNGKKDCHVALAAVEVRVAMPFQMPRMPATVL